MVLDAVEATATGTSGGGQPGGAPWTEGVAPTTGATRPSGGANVALSRALEPVGMPTIYVSSVQPAPPGPLGIPRTLVLGRHQPQRVVGPPRICQSYTLPGPGEQREDSFRRCSAAVAATICERCTENACGPWDMFYGPVQESRTATPVGPQEQTHMQHYLEAQGFPPIAQARTAPLYAPRRALRVFTRPCRQIAPKPPCLRILL